MVGPLHSQGKMCLTRGRSEWQADEVKLRFYNAKVRYAISVSRSQSMIVTALMMKKGGKERTLTYDKLKRREENTKTRPSFS